MTYFLPLTRREGRKIAANGLSITDAIFFSDWPLLVPVQKNIDILIFFLNRDVLAVLQIEAEMEEEAKWTGGNSGAPDDDDDVPTPFKIDELVCVRDDARGGRDGTQYGCQVRLCTGWSTWSRKIFC